MVYNKTFLKLKALDYKLVFRCLILLLLSARLFTHLLYSPESGYQISRDLEYAKAFILLLVIIAIYRGIKLTDWKVWAYLGLSIVAGVVCFKVRKYTPEAYGELLYYYMKVRACLQLLFVGLMLDLIRHKPYRWDVYLKNPGVVFYILFSIVFVVTNHDMIIPLFCPMVAVFLTRFDAEKKKKFMLVIAGGIYLAFAKCFTQSLMQRPGNFLDGRYVGVFASPTTIGFSIGCALIACIFLVLYFVKKKNKIATIIASILILYPLVATVMCSARCVFFGIITMILGLFIFMTSKNRKALIGKIGLSVGVLLLGLLMIFAFSRFLDFLIVRGIVEESNLTHNLALIRLMTGGNVNESSPYTARSFWYALDMLTAGRVGIWQESTRQIELIGHSITNLSGNIPHNMFLTVLVRYGVIGAVPYFLWWAAFFYEAYKLPTKDYTSKLWIILWLSFLFGVYFVHYEMLENIGGTVLLLSTVFLITPPVEDGPRDQNQG